MKRRKFFPSLAVDSIRKNKRLYVPYILTCVGMIMMYYIVSSLVYGEMLNNMAHSDSLRTVLGLGRGVIAVFACLFLFYTDSFLMKRRKKEFGLYNILGMKKRDIGITIFWETMIVFLIAVVSGLFLGILLSKGAELLLVNIIRSSVNYNFNICTHAVVDTLMVYAAIFVLLTLNSLRQVASSSAIKLLRSESVGEKPPKANWLLGTLGAVILAAAYGLALTIKEPLTAFTLFFFAVIMVIAATYMLMIAGSVLMCRILQRCKSYYYKANHFVSVSSMAYRMKRNGAGLASVCILITMVLVMLSSTTCLYFGGEDAMKARYPRQLDSRFIFESIEGLSDENIDKCRSVIDALVSKDGVNKENICDYRYAYAYCSIENGVVTVNSELTLEESNSSFTDNTRIVRFVPVGDYNKTMGVNETLADDEVMIFNYRMDYKENEITLDGNGTYRVKKVLDKFINDPDSASLMVPTLFVVVNDLNSSLKDFMKAQDALEDDHMYYNWFYQFDTGLDSDGQIKAFETLRSGIRDDIDAKFGDKADAIHVFIECREYERDSFLGLYGSLLFLGIMLSIVFIFAAVLIIYYKQISEGYEDNARFDIMQKVGMTGREIRKSINSQLLTVFYLPLIVAGCHMAFAFPMIYRLLVLFNLNNIRLFAITSVVCFAAFAIFYAIVYKVTSNSYYKIVSEKHRKAE